MTDAELKKALQEEVLPSGTSPPGEILPVSKLLPAPQTIWASEKNPEKKLMFQTRQRNS